MNKKMKKMNKRYAVYCTADDNYVLPSIVALESVRRFHPECDFFVIGNQSIISKEKIEFLKRFDIYFLHSDKNELFADSRWSNTCYLMLFGPEMLWEKGYEYSLGLDADVLCVQPLDLDGVFSMTVGYAGIENQNPMRGNFKDPDFICRKYGLSEEDLYRHNTNTGVVFWNNKTCVVSRLWERSVKCYQIGAAERPDMFNGDQGLFALVFILDPELPWLILPKGYNYRVHNVDDQKEHIREKDIRIYHFTGPKPWKPAPLKDALLDPYILSHIDKWFELVDEQGIFNRDLTIRSKRLWERVRKTVSYWCDDRMRAIIVKESTLGNMARFVVRISRFVSRKARGGLRKAKAVLQFADGDH